MSESPITLTRLLQPSDPHKISHPLVQEEMLAE